MGRGLRCHVLDLRRDKWILGVTSPVDTGFPATKPPAMFPYLGGCR